MILPLPSNLFLKRGRGKGSPKFTQEENHACYHFQ